MKMKMFLAIATLFAYGQGFAQSKVEVPAVVKENFKKQYPSITDVDWQKEDNGSYEAEFEMNHVDHSLSYDAAGNLLETEVEITSSTLPKATLDYLAKNKPGQKIKEAAKITLANSEIMYEAEVGNADLLFDSKGVFIKQKIKSDKTD